MGRADDAPPGSGDAFRRTEVWKSVPALHLDFYRNHSTGSCWLPEMSWRLGNFAGHAR